jgi:hypothetical protein
MRCLVFLLLLTSSARAGEYETAMKLQIDGAISMGAGILHLAASSVAAGFYIDGEYKLQHCSRTCGGDWGVSAAATFSTFALGVIFTIVGIPTYIEGTVRLRNLGVRARLDPGGLRVTF